MFQSGSRGPGAGDVWLAAQVAEPGVFTAKQRLRDAVLALAQLTQHLPRQLLSGTVRNNQGAQRSAAARSARQPRPGLPQGTRHTANSATV